MRKSNFAPLFAEDVNNISSTTRIIEGFDITINKNNVTVSDGKLIHQNNLYELQQTTFTIPFSSSNKHRFDLIYFDPQLHQLKVKKGSEVDSDVLPTSPDVDGFVLYRLHVTSDQIESDDLRIFVQKRFDDAEVENLTVNKDLVVNGTTTIVNSQNVEVEDNIITLNKGETGNGVTAGKAGIQIDRGQANDAVFFFDESDDKWKVGYVNENGEIVNPKTIVINGSDGEEVVFDNIKVNNYIDIGSKWWIKQINDGLVFSYDSKNNYHYGLYLFENNIHYLTDLVSFTVDLYTFVIEGKNHYRLEKRSNDDNLYWNGYKVWHEGNDGSGSGLDADLLDGHHASDFAPYYHNHDDRYYTKSESDSRYYRKDQTLEPTSNSEYDVGTSSRKFRNAYFSGNVYVGDVVFQNGWRITEYDDNKQKLPYLRVLNENGDEMFIIYNSTILKLIFKFEMFMKKLINSVKKILKR